MPHLKRHNVQVHRMCPLQIKKVLIRAEIHHWWWSTRNMVDSALSNHFAADDFPVHFPEGIPLRVAPPWNSPEHLISE